MSWPTRVQQAGLVMLLALLTMFAWARACASGTNG